VIHSAAGPRCFRHLALQGPASQPTKHTHYTKGPARAQSVAPGGRERWPLSGRIRWPRFVADEHFRKPRGRAMVLRQAAPELAARPARPELP
jgi:hypothetical protein